MCLDLPDTSENAAGLGCTGNAAAARRTSPASLSGSLSHSVTSGDGSEVSETFTPITGIVDLAVLSCEQVVAAFACRWQLQPASMNTVLAQRTGCRPFDFDQDSERAAMGELLGRISDREFPRTGVLISAIVNYLDANDAGPGFYRLAQRHQIISPGVPRQRQWEFWAAHVGQVFAAYARPRGAAS
jgi:hypothetical protein